MLIEEYGSLENCPISITAEIVDLEEATMTEANYYEYLSKNIYG